MIAGDPRVVIVREQVDLRIGNERLRARDDRPGEEQVAELVTLDD
jgi:hypothetical protein